MIIPFTELVKKSINSLNHDIVVTAGVFDLVDLNHLEFIKEARKQGNLLTVGIFSDEWVKKIRNKSPFWDENYRVKFLGEVLFNDLVVLIPFGFEQKFLLESMAAIYVKGGNFTEERLYQEDTFLIGYSGKVKILSKLEEYPKYKPSRRKKKE